MALLDSGQGCELEWDIHLITVEAMEMAVLPDAAVDPVANKTRMGGKKDTKRTILAPFKAPKQLEKPLSVPEEEDNRERLSNVSGNANSTNHGNNGNHGNTSSAASVDAALLSKLVNKISNPTAQADYRDRYASDSKATESNNNDTGREGKRQKMDPTAIDAELDDMWAEEEAAEAEREYSTGREVDPLKEDLVAAQRDSQSQGSQYSEKLEKRGGEMGYMNNENNGNTSNTSHGGNSGGLFNEYGQGEEDASKSFYAPSIQSQPQETVTAVAATTNDEDYWGF